MSRSLAVALVVLALGCFSPKRPPVNGDGGPAADAGGCARDADCGVRAYCAHQMCIPLGVGGTPCTGADQCISGICGVIGTGHCCTIACVQDSAHSCAPDDCNEVGVCSYPCSANCAKDVDCHDARICDHGTCVWPTADGGGNNGPQCLINGVFVSAGATNPADHCEYCDPAQNQLDWTSAIALGATYTPPPNTSVTGIWSFSSLVGGHADSLLVGEVITEGTDTSYQITRLDSSLNVQSSVSLGATPSLLAVLDLNGDGFNDLVVAGFAGSSNGHLVSLLLNDTRGGFVPGALYPMAALTPPSYEYPEDLQVGDFNGDGRLQLNVAVQQYLDPAPAGVTRFDFYALDGDGGLAAPSSVINQEPDYGSLLVGDSNGDGKTDVLFWTPGFSAATSLTLLLSQGGDKFGSSTEPYPMDAGYGLGGAASADINGDGRSDVAFANPDGTMSTELADSSGHLGTAITSVVPGDPGGSVRTYSILAADFNGDGKQDLVRFDIYCHEGECGRALTLWFGAGDGRFGAPDHIGADLPLSWYPNAYSVDQRAMVALDRGIGRPDLVVSYVYLVSYQTYGYGISVLRNGCR